MSGCPRVQTLRASTSLRRGALLLFRLPVLLRPEYGKYLLVRLHALINEHFDLAPSFGRAGGGCSLDYGELCWGECWRLWRAVRGAVADEPTTCRAVSCRAALCCGGAARRAARHATSTVRAARYVVLMETRVPVVLRCVSHKIETTTCARARARCVCGGVCSWQRRLLLYLLHLRWWSVPLNFLEPRRRCIAFGENIGPKHVQCGY